MESIDDCQALLSNCEVYRALQEQRQDRGDFPLSTKKGLADKSFPKDLGPQNVLTIEFEAVPESIMDPQKLRDTLSLLSQHPLTKGERLQMVNNIPKSIIDLHVVSAMPSPKIDHRRVRGAVQSGRPFENSGYFYPINQKLAFYFMLGQTHALEPVAADAQLPEAHTRVESLCMSCGQNGFTTFLLVSIPHFKETVLSSFECPHCHSKNNKIVSARTIADCGVKTSLECSRPEDLNRQIVKSEYATVCIPELELEIPASFTLQENSVQSQESILTTVEGLILHIIEDLSLSQGERQAESPIIHQKICEVIEKLDRIKSGAVSFTLILDDPTGTSHIEHLSASSGSDDPRLKFEKYPRSAEIMQQLGFSSESSRQPQEPETEGPEVYRFQGSCPSCGLDCLTKMLPIDIPYFKQVIIMATTCDACGYKSSEVKCGSAISRFGRKITLSFESSDDLSRDILKSETCSISIPEIGLELQEGTLGGRFTTLEGILSLARSELAERASFSLGDSADLKKSTRFHSLLSGLDEICAGARRCTIIIDDPLANSHLQNLCAPDPDPQMVIEDYKRTQEQDEDFGIADMAV